MDSLIKTNQEIIENNFDRINELLENFIINQDVKQSSKDLYKRTLMLYLNWLQQKKYHFFEISRTDLLKYKTELLNSGMSSLTVSSYITTVRRFYEWTEANKLYPNVAKGIKSPKRKHQFKKQALSQFQSINLLNFLVKTENIRDFALVNLLIRTDRKSTRLNSSH